MKVLIFGDSHLGRRNFKIKKREEDFEQAFKQVVDYGINEEVDAVIHTGDLFDTGKPSVRTMIFAIKQLERFKQDGVPVFITAGSHDVGVNESFLKVLDELNLVINLSDKRLYEQEEDKIIVNGAERKDLFVCGLPGRRSNINEILKLVEVNAPSDCFKVFLFHHIISDISTLFNSVKKSCLPKGFDLYVSGHWHEHYESSFNNTPILYPGSTENFDFGEMKKDKNKGFIIYDTGERSHEFVELDTRPSIIKEVECTGLAPSEVVDELLNLIKPGGGEMLFFVLKGRLSKGLKSTINRRRVYDEAKQEGYLFCRVYTGSLNNPKEEQTIVERKSIGEIEEDFFKKKGLKDEEVSLARSLIRELGKDYTASDLKEKKEEVVKLLKGEVL